MDGIILVFFPQNCFRLETVCSASDSVMENDTCVEEKSCDGPTAVDPVKQPVSTAPFRYTKVRRIEFRFRVNDCFPNTIF